MFPNRAGYDRGLKRQSQWKVPSEIWVTRGRNPVEYRDRPLDVHLPALGTGGWEKWAPCLGGDPHLAMGTGS